MTLQWIVRCTVLLLDGWRMQRGVTQLVLVGLALVAPHSVGAQGAPAALGACAPPAGAIDAVVDTIFAVLSPPRSLPAQEKIPLPAQERERLTLLLQGLTQFFSAPRTLASSAYGEWRASPRSPAGPAADTGGYVVPAIAGEFTFAVQRDGAITDRRMVWSTLVPALDTAVERMLDSAHAARALSWTVGDAGSGAGDALALRLTRHRPDSTTDAVQPLFTAALQRIRLDHLVRMLPGGPYPRYPAAEEWRRQEGEVVLQFVITSDGRAVRETVRVLRLSSEAFLPPVLDVIPKLRFSPAHAGNCGVAMLVQMPFAFLVPRK